MQEQLVDQNLAALTTLFHTLVEFAVRYGFQFLGALVVLLVGLKVASWCGERSTRLAEAKGVDVTLGRFSAIWYVSPSSAP